MDAEEIEGIVRLLRIRARRDGFAADAAELIEELRAENTALRNSLADLVARLGTRPRDPGSLPGPDRRHLTGPTAGA